MGFLENLLGKNAASVFQSNQSWPTLAPKPFYPSVSSPVASNQNYTQQVLQSYPTPNIQRSSSGGRYTITPIDNSNKGGGGNGGDNISSGGGSTSDINAALGATNTVQPNYPADSFEPTLMAPFYQKAFLALTPYYTRLLEEAGGDLQKAMQNLETDYVMGKRVRVEDFTAAMANLGITLPKEQTALAGGLNQRGIALTENPVGQTTYAGGGLAASDVGSLGMDQKLRTEAVQRTRQRGLESEAITKLVGGQSSQQGYRKRENELKSEQETKAQSSATTMYADELARKQSGIDKADVMANVANNGGGNSGGSGNFMDYYKQWNPDAAKADFAAVYGNDLAKLQRSKPL